jgi:hypothetical protein
LLKVVKIYLWCIFINLIFTTTPKNFGGAHHLSSGKKPEQNPKFHILGNNASRGVEGLNKVIHGIFWLVGLDSGS